MPGPARASQTAGAVGTVGSMAHDRSAFGAFLRARRDAITPAQAGVSPIGDLRRVPGLRRDELARLAGISPEYYVKLEQGRAGNVSAEVLDSLARALRLDAVERAHLHDLAQPERANAGRAEAAQRAEPGMLRLLQALPSVPVLLVGHRTTVLARNQLLSAVLGDPLLPGQSFVDYLFGPVGRSRIVNWADFASASIAALRREGGRRPGDAKLTALVDRLRAEHDEVEAWWADQAVRDYASVPKVIDQPVVGRMRFDVEIVEQAGQPDQRLVVYTAEPDGPTAQALAFLGSWAALPVDHAGVKQG